MPLTRTLPSLLAWLQVEVAFAACHHKLCLECARNLTRQDKKPPHCPFCRRLVVGFQRVSATGMLISSGGSGGGSSSSRCISPKHSGGGAGGAARSLLTAAQ
jgi:hypothetical protein